MKPLSKVRQNAEKQLSECLLDCRDIPSAASILYYIDQENLHEFKNLHPRLLNQIVKRICIHSLELFKEDEKAFNILVSGFSSLECIKSLINLQRKFASDLSINTDTSVNEADNRIFLGDKEESITAGHAIKASEQKPGASKLNIGPKLKDLVKNGTSASSDSFKTDSDFSPQRKVDASLNILWLVQEILATEKCSMRRFLMLEESIAVEWINLIAGGKLCNWASALLSSNSLFNRKFMRDSNFSDFEDHVWIADGSRLALFYFKQLIELLSSTTFEYCHLVASFGARLFTLADPLESLNVIVAGLLDCESHYAMIPNNENFVKMILPRFQQCLQGMATNSRLLFFSALIKVVERILLGSTLENISESLDTLGRFSTLFLVLFSSEDIQLWLESENFLQHSTPVLCLLSSLLCQPGLSDLKNRFLRTSRSTVKLSKQDFELSSNSSVIRYIKRWGDASFLTRKSLDEQASKLSKFSKTDEVGLTEFILLLCSYLDTSQKVNVMRSQYLHEAIIARLQTENEEARLLAIELVHAINSSLPKSEQIDFQWSNLLDSGPHNHALDILPRSAITLKEFNSFQICEIKEASLQRERIQNKEFSHKRFGDVAKIAHESGFIERNSFPLKISRINFMKDIIQLLKEDSFESQMESLRGLENLLPNKKSFGSEFEDFGSELFLALVSLQNDYDIDDFDILLQKNLRILLGLRPDLIAPKAVESIFFKNFSIQRRSIIISSLALAAQDIAIVNSSSKKELADITGLSQSKLHPFFQYEMAIPVFGIPVDSEAQSSSLKLLATMGNDNQQLLDSFFKPLLNGWWILLRDSYTKSPIFESSSLNLTIQCVILLFKMIMDLNLPYKGATLCQFWDFLLSARHLTKSSNDPVMKSIISGMVSILSLDESFLAAQNIKLPLSETTSYCQQIVGSHLSVDDSIKLHAKSVLTRCQYLMRSYSSSIENVLNGIKI